MSSVLNPSIQKCISIFGDIDGKALHNELLKSEFRLAQSLGVQKEFSRDWSMDFKNRYKDTIEKVSAASIDDLKANFSIEEVNDYFDMIDKMMKDPQNPFLLINFDEIGFEKRPQKGKRKDVYIVKNLNFPPFWREPTDPQHVSLVI